MDLRRLLIALTAVTSVLLGVSPGAAQEPEAPPTETPEEEEEEEEERVVGDRQGPPGVEMTSNVDALGAPQSVCYRALDAARFVVASESEALAVGRVFLSGPDYCGILKTIAFDQVRSGPLTTSLASRSTDRVMDALADPDPDTTGVQGTGAQTTAVPSVTPVDRTSFVTSYANADGADFMIATLAINPGSAFSRNNPDIWTSRFMDVSVTAPIRVDASEDDAIDAFAINARVNLRGLFGSPSSEVRRLAADSIRGALTNQVVAENEFSRVIDVYLAAMPSSDAPEIASRQACLTEVLLGQLSCIEGLVARADAMRDRRSELAREIAERRDEIDRYYFGVDFRLLLGDPGLSGMLPDDGTTMLASLAAGRRFGHSNALSIELRGRLGYTGTRGEGYVRRAVDFAAGAEARYPFSPSRSFRFGMGVEGNYDFDKNDGDEVPDGTNLRVGLSMPMSEDTSFDLGLSWPIGDTTRVPIFTISTSVSDLFSGLRKSD